MAEMDKDRVVGVLNRLLGAELAGVVRYTHYSFLVFGFSRIPIVSWLRDQATESLSHAQQIGEWITALGAHPSLSIGPLLESHKHDITAILKESLAAEGEALALYRELLDVVKDRMGTPGLIVVSKAETVRSAIETMQRSRRRWRIAYTGSSMASVQAAVRAGLGLSILPQSSVTTGMRVVRGHRDPGPLLVGAMRAPGAPRAIGDALERVIRETLEVLANSRKAA